MLEETIGGVQVMPSMREIAGSPNPACRTGPGRPAAFKLTGNKQVSSSARESSLKLGRKK